MHVHMWGGAGNRQKEREVRRGRERKLTPASTWMCIIFFLNSHASYLREWGGACACECRCLQRLEVFPTAAVSVVVSHGMCVMGTELRSSAEAVHFVNQ